MTKIPSVVEVVEAIRQRHIHLKANNPVGFVHLFADIKKALTAEREAAVWEALLELEGEARLAIVEWENSADYDHTTNDGLYSFIRQISLKREALTPPTK